MRKWKVGETGWLVSCEGYGCLTPQQVVVEQIKDGRRPITARARDGTVFICEHSDLRTRRAKAIRTADPAPTEEQKIAADALAERRMKQLMDEKRKKDRAQFDLIRDGLRTIDQVEQLYEELNGGKSDSWQRVRDLAEAGLFAEAYEQK